MLSLDHKHMIVNAKTTNPPRAGDEEKVVDWMRRLVFTVGMKLVVGPHAHYCEAPDNNGITAACCIETSHASLHVWDKTDPPILRFDLYSCATFDPFLVLQMLDEFMIYDVEHLLLDRNHRITPLSIYDNTPSA